MRKAVYAFFACAVSLCFSANADVPVRSEELIYTIDAFNGMNYSQTYARESADSIYLLANTNNFLHLRKTLVYYWPPAGQWLTDLDRLDEPFEGVLEVEQSGTIVRKTESDVFLYYNEPAEFENDWKVFIGAEATAESGRIEAIETEYDRQLADYGEKYRMYENVKKAFIDRMQEYSAAGKNTGDLLARFTQLEEPVPPAPPPYTELNGGKKFIVNLPEGMYVIRLRNKEGLVLEGSEKRLVVFDERRGDGIGYDVVPSDKWTIPSKSVTPTNVIYTDGTTDLYVIPFLQKEYNDLAYDKLMDNAGKGNPSLYRWEKIREVTSSRIEKTTGSESEVILEEKFYVQPMQSGAILGYKIEKYDPEGIHRNKNYSFKGFHIPVHPTETSITIKLQNPNGTYYPLSGREIRIVTRSDAWILPCIFIFAPLIVMTIAMIRRNGVYGKTQARVNRSA